MENKVWQPLFTEETIDMHALYPGIPDWMKRSLGNWTDDAEKVLIKYYPIYEGGPFLGYLERTLRCTISIDIDYSRIWEYLSDDDNDFLTYVDLLLDSLYRFVLPNQTTDTDPKSPIRLIQRLDSLLESSGSEWKIGTRADRIGLVKRLGEGVEDVVYEVVRSSESAGQKLKEAFGYCFGRDPNPSLAYSLAIKAVEVAAVPVVSPNNRIATLGNVIGEMKGNQADRCLPMTKKDAMEESHAALVTMMNTLWLGHSDRHGGGEPEIPITQEAAETAVILASSIIYFFSSGVAQRRSFV